MDQAIRNKLRNVVTQCRKLLEDAVAQVLQGQFGIYATGKKDEVHVDDDAKMKHLSDEDLAYRKDILDHLEHVKALGYKPTDSLAQLVREIAFTHLNRFCAYKMMEARSLIRESVSKGLKSQGFLFYLADHEADEKRANSGQQDVAYRHFLNWLGSTLSEEIGVLFNPHDSANRLYPPQRLLDGVLDLLNDEVLADIWTQDETIGWVYQYFTPKELRDAVRDPKQGGSQAPRNSYELAFRNQFFTPRYVVEFLTDNTLGRIWYEMQKGDTKLNDQCRYMVRRPTEFFLKNGEQPPKDVAEGRDDLSQEEMLKLPVHLPHRPKKDPRELKILDPACGSGHFLLYCFDLLLTIYEEAYGDPELGPALQQDYPTLDALKRDVPRLILAHNLHGIDIDLRASQIAALALWLRCQRAYQEMGLKKDRPKITRSNFVCAEPMPGEPAMLKEFVGQLEPRLLGQLVEVVFDKMKLAGEAGSLLKIEEDIRTAVASAKQQWEAGPVEVQRSLFDRSEPKPKQKRFNLSGVTDDDFFNEAEAKVVEALRTYAETSHNGQRLQRRLFSDDAVRGFAFVDICRKRFDVVLMNPPFGLGVKQNFAWLKATYPDGYVDLLSAFVSRAECLCRGLIGAITSRSILVTKKLERLRTASFLPRVTTLLDLGWAVMDGATVQSCAYTFAVNSHLPKRFIAIDRMQVEDKSQPLDFSSQGSERIYLPDRDALALLPRAQVLYALPSKVTTLLQSESRLRSTVLVAKHGMNTFNNFRFLRLRWEVPVQLIGENCEWEPLSKGGPFAVFYSDLPLLVRWNRSGDELAEENRRANGQTAQARQASTYYRLAGATYSRRSSRDFGVRMLPAGCIIGEKGPAVLTTGEFSKEFVIALLNSRLMNSLVHIQANAKQYDSGILERLPWISPTSEVVAEVETLSRNCIRAVRDIACMNETDSGFTGCPFEVSLTATSESWKKRLQDTECTLESSMYRISHLVDSTYGIDSQELRQIVRGNPENDDQDTEPDDDGGDEEGMMPIALSPLGVAQAALSLCFGAVVGRWDAKVITGERKATPPDLFAPLPQIPPASLSQASLALHAIGQAPADGSFAIDRDGIIIDDSDQSDDVVKRTREALELIWQGRADAIEKEACEILGVKELRDYFRKPGKGGFWDDHISRYSTGPARTLGGSWRFGVRCAPS